MRLLDRWRRRWRRFLWWLDDLETDLAHNFAYETSVIAVILATIALIVSLFR
jgi:hypothetical protein|nr:MAG TPA: hypothetical protein [Caudoviricetes sp.]